MSNLKTVHIRPAHRYDSELFERLRRDPECKKYLKGCQRFEPGDHGVWFLYKTTGDDARLFTICLPDGKGIGYVLGERDMSRRYTISICLGPGCRWQGAGTVALRTVLKELGDFPFLAEIHKEDRAGTRLFESAGFTKVKEGKVFDVFSKGERE